MKEERMQELQKKISIFSEEQFAIKAKEAKLKYIVCVIVFFLMALIGSYITY